MLRGLRSSRLFRGSSRRNSSNEMPAPIVSQKHEPSGSDSDQTHHVSSTCDSGYHASRDARDIVKLFQCASCSKILEVPFILPCRNSVCTTCMELLIPGGELQVFECPFTDCNEQHKVEEVAKDFKLTELVGLFQESLGKYVASEEDPATVLVGIEGSDQPPLPFHGGRLAATFELVYGGNVPYDAQLTYVSESPDTEILIADATNLKRLRDAIRPMVECNVCCGMLLEPVTTACGHTYCLSCLQRAWDSDPRCPCCRRASNIPSISLPKYSNGRITDILVSLYPGELAERSTQAMLENRAGIDGLDTPIFVCTPSLPHVPEYLRIFEPRYRLMLRRCLEGNRRFGMVWQNPHDLPGEEHRYNRIGTMLEIAECRWEQTGEANIICVGLHKFIVNRCGWRDEYVVADVERYEDFSVSEESDYERSELALYSSHPQFQFFLEAQSTEALMQRALAELRACFQRNRDLARWINNSMGSPPTDARAMGYYIATIFNPHNPSDPRHNLLKCRLLQERSPRVRLKTMLLWFYQSPWYLQGGSVVSTTGEDQQCLLS